MSSRCNSRARTFTTTLICPYPESCTQFRVRVVGLLPALSLQEVADDLGPVTKRIADANLGS